ncbi:hypothetical protein EVAR_86604_1 [Eumeta japonica]|uniref:Uncharacterized protein n=1 Tax=Eumeta variegata TaxID=151549 RepID=A0A4C1W2S8_EUMVA|nr:hypothetical protein EVAR_86604_1 [Eumeta japonica]
MTPFVNCQQLINLESHFQYGKHPRHIMNVAYRISKRDRTPSAVTAPVRARSNWRPFACKADVITTTPRNRAAYASKTPYKHLVTKADPDDGSEQAVDSKSRFHTPIMTLGKFSALVPVSAHGRVLPRVAFNLASITGDFDEAGADVAIKFRLHYSGTVQPSMKGRIFKIGIAVRFNSTNTRTKS